MAAVLCSSRIVAGGDEGSDSDDGDWDIGVVRHEPQVGPSLPVPAARQPWPGGLGEGGGLGLEP